jgi:hypothetical protein
VAVRARRDWTCLQLSCTGGRGEGRKDDEQKGPGGKAIQTDRMAPGGVNGGQLNQLQVRHKRLVIGVLNGEGQSAARLRGCTVYGSDNGVDMPRREEKIKPGLQGTWTIQRWLQVGLIRLLSRS